MAEQHPPKPPRKTPLADPREARLAQALRANLRRRKEGAGRDAASDLDKPGGEPPEGGAT